MTVTRGQLWRSARDRLAGAGIATPALDARLLLRHVLGLDETGLIVSEGQGVDAAENAAYEALIARRLSREPVARILGTQEFYGLAFGLNGATLVPRPETEMLVDFAIAALRDHAGPSVLDLGTGTGCILLSVLANLPDARGVGVDIAPDAIAQARANADALGLGGRSAFHPGSWFAPVEEQRFDLIVSNPPYIARTVLETLAPEVAEHDPALALDGGEDGLGPYRIIAAGALAHLAPGGTLVLEIGYDQGAAVSALLDEAGMSGVAVHKDLAGHDRMVTGLAQKPR